MKSKNPRLIKCTPATAYRQARATHWEFVNLIIPINRFPMEHPHWGPGEYEAHVKKLFDTTMRLPLATYPARVVAMEARMNASFLMGKMRHDEEMPRSPYD